MADRKSVAARVYIRGPEVDGVRAHGPTKRYEDIRAGLLPPPIRHGRRYSRFILDEIEAVVAAEIRGDSEEQRRELVRQLVAARQKRAA
jgi:prophage regulatory protein